MRMMIKSGMVAAAALMAVSTVAAQAATLVVNVAGARGFDDFGTAGNTVQLFNIGAGATITAVSYNVNITAPTPSWLSEATLAFTDGASNEGVFLSPGIGVDAPGTQSFSGGGDLVSLGLSFVTLADGILRLEYFDSFNDAGVSPDSIWNSGTVTFTYTPSATVVPEPATWAMMLVGFGMTGAAVRYRRRKSAVSFA